MSQEPLEEIRSSLSVAAFREPSKKFNQVPKELTEKVITQCFLTHYYSLPWIRDYAMRIRFKAGSLEAGRDLITVLIFYFKATRRFPTVRGLQIINAVLEQARQFLNCENFGYLDYSKPVFFEKVGYRLFFHQRAIEAGNANHLALAALWEKLVSEPGGTFVWWNIYASAKVEETRILGSVTETNYWEKETQRATASSSLFCAKYQDTMQQNSSIIEFYKLKKMREKQISDYRVLAVAAEDNELAALWGQVSHQIEQDNLDCANYFFLAAYSLLQAKKLKQHASTIWKIASVVFQQLAEKPTFAVEEPSQVRQLPADLEKLSEMINHQIKTDLSHATSYDSKIKNADSSNSHMIHVWKKAVSYFEDNAAQVANCTLLDCSDLTSFKEMFNFLKGKIDSLKGKIDQHLGDSVFHTALRFASYHMDKLLKRDLQISEWADNGFTEISTLLNEKRNSSEYDIDHYLELAQKKVRLDWSPVVDYEIDCQLKQQFATAALSFSDQLFWDMCNKFLEIIKKYKQKAANLRKDDHQNLFSFCYQVIEEAEQCTKIVIVKNFPVRQQLDDRNIRMLEKIIELEEELLEVGENPEKSLLQWRQNLFLKDMKLRNANNTEEIPVKIDLFKGAKISIGYAASCYGFMSELKVTEIDRFAKRFEEAADLFIQAAEETEEDLVSFYSQAATALHAAVEIEISPFKVVGREDPILAEKVDFFRWIGTQYLDAAQKLKEGDKLNSKCEELKAKFFQLLSKHVNPQNYQKMLNLYRRTKDFKRLEPPLIKRWNGIYDSLEKAVNTSISNRDFRLTNMWEQRADSAKRDVSEWKEILFEYLMNAFEAGINNEKASTIWDKVVKEAQAALTLKAQKYRACLDKDESRLNSLKNEIPQIQKKIKDLIYKISSHQAVEQES
jgi:hypothetical protein